MLEGDVAVDTEATGLDFNRDRLCVLQVSDGGGDAHLVVFDYKSYDAPNLKNLLLDRNKVKIFHYARFDVAVIYKHLGVMTENIYCTKIASRLARTYTEKHGLKDLCKELLDLQISKEQQQTYWGGEALSDKQIQYAANDVLYLHKLREKLNAILIRENRLDLAKECFEFIKVRVKLDLSGWVSDNIFNHD